MNQNLTFESLLKKEKRLVTVKQHLGTTQLLREQPLKDHHTQYKQLGSDRIPQPLAKNND